MAVDDHGNAMEWNGNSWSKPVAADATRGITTSTGQASVMLTAAVTTGFTAVSCGTPTFCVAVDGQGDAVPWDGSQWDAPHAIESARVPLVAISCNFEPSCVAVDAKGNAVLGSGDEIDVSRGQGLAWSQPQQIDQGALTSVSCPSPYFCVAADGNGDVMAYHPGAWSASVAIDGSPITSISCTSVTSCVAVDNQGRAVTWNGSSWSSPQPVTGGTPATSISCTGPSNCQATDTAGDVTRSGS